jgi:hypothetical protein
MKARDICSPHSRETEWEERKERFFGKRKIGSVSVMPNFEPDNFLVFRSPRSHTDGDRMDFGSGALTRTFWRYIWYDIYDTERSYYAGTLNLLIIYHNLLLGSSTYYSAYRSSIVEIPNGVWPTSSLLLWNDFNFQKYDRENSYLNQVEFQKIQAQFWAMRNPLTGSAAYAIYICMYIYVCR